MYDRKRYYVRSVRLFLAENNDPCDAAHPFFFPSVVSAKKIQQEKEKGKKIKKLQDISDI